MDTFHQFVLPQTYFGWLNVTRALAVVLLIIGMNQDFMRKRTI